MYELLRSNSFGQRVREAYHNTCAATGLQLSLIVGAHIAPVSTGINNDEVSNGIALSPTFHEALDDGLIYLFRDKDDRIFLKLNERVFGQVRHRSGDGAKELILQYTEEGGKNGKEIPRVRLPKDPKAWPDREMFREGNKKRNLYDR